MKSSSAEKQGIIFTASVFVLRAGGLIMSLKKEDER